MKFVIPVVLALLGLGAGIGAGFALKPPPEETADACAPGAPAAEGGHGAAEAPAAEGADPCAPEHAEIDPFEPEEPAAAEAEHGGEGEHPLYVALEKPFVVPVFTNEKVTAMMVVSLSVATVGEDPELVHALEPRLRDRFLEVMFLHSNSGGFSGSFTTGRKMEDLKTALLKAARQVMGAEMVTEVLVTEINRQDV
ncbi:flagellar basal body-associated FliL family protein [Amaricoccus sp. B4]|uniref:flagellar basal body-associated FliL family protein n=1 Tax=Amaricoccus sp. B4 TaxID=3368557 RepID=UPI0037200BB2